MMTDTVGISRDGRRYLLTVKTAWGHRYFSADGTRTPDSKTWHLTRTAARLHAETSGTLLEATAKQVQDEASRQNRNRNSRERYDMMRSLGLVKTTYGWE